MSTHLITGRSLYRFLWEGIGRPSTPIPIINQKGHYTQTDFWWNFLSAGVPEAPLLPYFSPESGRSRSLSNLMNRTIHHAMPVKLYRLLEEHLNADALLDITIWVSEAIDRELLPMTMHHALSQMEDQVIEAGEDVEFLEVSPFFLSLRPEWMGGEGMDSQTLFFWAAFRIALLGLHALYGDRMAESPALGKLRLCRFCSPKLLMEAVRDVIPRTRVHRMSLTQMTREKSREQEAQAPSLQPLESLRSAAVSALPEEEKVQEHMGQGCGWYVVANWMDDCIAVNDAPHATYDGANMVDTMSNGTLVYVMAAEGYRGLHVSPAVWGKVMVKGRLAYVPMNLLVKVTV
ncbi:MAG: hypothetical protein IJ083_11815 [Clostridia bacterium]|nr:hypothetical protein [Clostridia bacterium]